MLQPNADRFQPCQAEIAIVGAMSLLDWIVARIHLHVFDRWFLHIGNVGDRKYYDLMPPVYSRIFGNTRSIWFQLSL